jgi:probable F420-dependent oxidoreductase
VRIGLNTVSMRAAELVDGAVLAEALGYDSVWYGEHIVLPYDIDYPVTSKPYGPQELIDPFVVLAAIAARTRRLRLATGVVQLPLRAPILAARQILGVDVLSGGRLDLGVGTGWAPAEYEAAGTAFATRGARLDEMLEFIGRLFQPGDAAWEGRFYRVGLTSFEPKPVQRPRPPVIVGGVVERALQRAARWDGWYGPVRSLDRFHRVRERIEAHRRALGREGEPFQYVIVFHQGEAEGGVPTREQLEAFFAAGADRIVVTPWAEDYDHALAHTERYAREIGLAP